MILPALLASMTSTSATVSVALDFDASAAPLRARALDGLEAELPPNATLTSSAADLRMTLFAREDRLELELVQIGGAIQRRAFTLDGGLEPALRLAIRTMVESVRQAIRIAGERRAPPPETVTATIAAVPTATAAPAQPEASGLIAGASFGTMWWARPSTALLGAELGLDYRIGPFDVGLRAGVFGLGCCAIEVPDRISGRAWVVFGGLGLRWQIWTFDRLRVSLFAEAGASWERLEADPIVFEGSSVAQVVTAVSPMARLGPAVAIDLFDRISIALSAGAWLRTARLTLVLPEPFTGEKAEVDGGLVVPFANLSIAVRLF